MEGKLTVPGGLHMPFHPFFDSVDVFFGIFEFVTHVCGLTAAEEAGLGRAPRLLLNGPASVLDTSGDVVGTTIGFGVCKIKVLSGGWGVVGEETDLHQA